MMPRFHVTVMRGRSSEQMPSGTFKIADTPLDAAHQFRSELRFIKSQDVEVAIVRNLDIEFDLENPRAAYTEIPWADVTGGMFEREDD